MNDDYQVLHHGKTSESARKLVAATNRRLDARDLDDYMVKLGPTLTLQALIAVRKAAWALGAQPETYERILRDREVPIGVQRMIRNPGLRTALQKRRGAERVSQMREAREHRDETCGKRAKIVAQALKAAANYRARPGLYHYLAGGNANLVYLKPTPLDWRSDCSQFVGSVYEDVGLPSPASVPHLWVSTSTIVRCPDARITTDPKPGDLGMYGDTTGPLATRYTHHVEIFCDAPGARFIGHGSPPYDSITPGEPDFFVTYNFLT